MKYVLYGRVIDSVKDEAVENGMVIVDGERILYAGERNDEMVTDDMQVRDAGNGTIMPGFIDAHAHLTGEESRNSSGTSAFDALLTVVKGENHPCESVHYKASSRNHNRTVSLLFYDNDD